MQQEVQRDLFDGEPRHLKPSSDLCASRHRGADTSTEAFASTTDNQRNAQRSRILAFISSRSNGATCDEVEVALNLNHQGASARITELSALQQITHGDERRKTRAGKSARVYRATIGEY